jgi:hypothetical protein
MARRKLNLSGTQVTASVLATLTGAVAASYLGVGGTLIGAAVGSIASTAGTELYRHYLGRSQERLRSAAMVRRYRSAARSAIGQSDQPGPKDPVQAAAHRLDGPQDPVQAAARRTAPWAAETEVFAVHQPGVAGQDTDPVRASSRLNEAPQDAPTEILYAPAETFPAAGGAFPYPDERTEVSAAATPTAPGQASDGIDDAVTRSRRGLGRRGWLMLAGVTAGIFLVTVVGITVFEALTGRPLGAVVWHQSGSGTSVGNVIGAHSGKHRSRHHPTGTATPTVSPSPSSVPTTPATTPTTPGTTPSSSASSSPGGLDSSTPSPAATR